jgi:hypothetical protein
MKRTMGMGLALSAALGLGTLAFSSALAVEIGSGVNNSGILLQNGGFNGSNFNATVGGGAAGGTLDGGGSYLTNTNVNQTANNSTAAVVGSGNSLNLNFNKACGLCIKGTSGVPVQ